MTYTTLLVHQKPSFCLKRSKVNKNIRFLILFKYFKYIWTRERKEKEERKTPINNKLKSP